MEWKNVTVFISSTFNDMHAERDYLVKYVFPELREWCVKRKLHLHDIDLRWGITAEDSRTKRTVGICLRDIDESRPFFVGFLGQRRGWQPVREDIDDDTLREYPELPERLKMNSVTEMEIEHALMRPLLRMAGKEGSVPLPARHAVVFLRDDTFTHLLNDAQKRVYTNRAEAAPGEDPAASRAVRAADEELSDFRRRLEEACPLLWHYQGVFDPALPCLELGGMEKDEGKGRLTDFTIDGRPLRDVLITALQREIVQEFPDRAEELALITVEETREFQIERMADGYIRREMDLAALNQYINGNSDSPFLLSAPSGSGKTTLLAYLYRQLRGSGGARALFRSCGSGSDTSGLMDLLISLFSQLGLEAPLDLEEFKRNIVQYLTQLSQEKTVLFIDALDQIPGGVSLLHWLPRRLPAGLKLVCAARSESLATEQELVARFREDGAFYALQPFSDDADKQALVDGYLRSHLKKLEPEEKNLLFRKKGASNPLYLKSALSELRVSGKREILKKRIQGFGDTPEALFDSMLERMEQDALTPGWDSAQFVSGLFALLSSSRYGLDREELTHLFQALFPDRTAEELDAQIQLYLRQIREFLFQWGNFSDLRYSTLRQAAAKRYAALSTLSHAMIAQEFLRQMGDKYLLSSARSAGEVIYHLARARDERAAQLLTDFQFLQQKLRVSGVLALTEDYDFVLEAAYLPNEKTAELKDLREALKSAAHVLLHRPQELASQLFLRFDAKLHGPLCGQIKACMTGPWLRPLVREKQGSRFSVLRDSGENILLIFPHRLGVGAVFAGGRVEVYAALNGALATVIRAGGGPLASAAAAGGRLYLGAEDGTLSAYALQNDALVGEEKISKCALTAVAGDESLAVAADEKNGAYILDAALRLKRKMTVWGGVSSVCVDASWIALGGRLEKVRLLDRNTLSGRKTVHLHLGVISALYFDQGFLYAGGCGETVMRVDPQTGKANLENNLSRMLYTRQIIVVNDRVYLFSGGSAASFDRELKTRESVSGFAQTFRQIYLEDETVYFLAENGRVGLVPLSAFLQDDEGGAPIEAIFPEGAERQLMLDGRAYGATGLDDQMVLAVNEAHRLRLYDGAGERQIESEDFQNERVASVCTDGGSFLLGRMTGQLMRMSRWGEIKDYIRYRDSINIDPDIPVCPVACDEAYVVYYRYGILMAQKRSSGELIKLEHPPACDSLSCLDGKAYAAWDDTITVFDLETRKKCGSLPVSGKVKKMQIDGGRMYFACAPGTVYIWSMESGEKPVPVFRGMLTDFVVSEAYLAVAMKDHTVRVYRDGALLTALTMEDQPWALAMEQNALYVGTYGGQLVPMHLENPAAQPLETARELPFIETEKSRRKPPLSPLKARLAGWTHIALSAVSLGALAVGMASTWNAMPESANGVMYALLNVLVLGAWFYFRGSIAWRGRTYRSVTKILPSALVLTLFCALFGGLCVFCGATGQEARVEGIWNTSFYAVLCQYLYLPFALISMSSTSGLNFGAVHKWCERYILATVLLTLLIMTIPLFQMLLG